MFDKSKFAAVVAIAVASGSSPAFAQTLEFFGPSLPMQFDGGGARHFYVYGYYGPFAPPMSSPVPKAMRDRSGHRSHASSTGAKAKARIVRERPITGLGAGARLGRVCHTFYVRQSGRTPLLCERLQRPHGSADDPA
jgi:hypothetical protein